jgi:hypothetical protein
LRYFCIGLVIANSVLILASSICQAQAFGPMHSVNTPNGFPAARCSRPANQEALRIEQLVEFLEKSRSMAAQNPLLLADVAYYAAELAASRHYLQSAMTGQD